MNALHNMKIYNKNHQVKLNKYKFFSCCVVRYDTIIFSFVKTSPLSNYLNYAIISSL